MRAWLFLMTLTVGAAGCHTGPRWVHRVDGSTVPAARLSAPRAAARRSAAVGPRPVPAAVRRPAAPADRLRRAAPPERRAREASGPDGGGPANYALSPPRQCDNQFFVAGCKKGDTTSACGGVCSAANACEDATQKPGADVGFLCPRFTLQSADMARAAADDFGPSPPFDYAVAGHDVDTGGLDPSAKTTCCQCYQLVYALPENEAARERQWRLLDRYSPARSSCRRSTPRRAVARTSTSSWAPAASARSTLATRRSRSSRASRGSTSSRRSPSRGRPTPAASTRRRSSPGCKNAQNLVTADTLGSATCTANVQSACDQFASSTLTPQALSDSVHSCLGVERPGELLGISTGRSTPRNRMPGAPDPGHRLQAGAAGAARGQPQRDDTGPGRPGPQLPRQLHDDHHAGLLQADLRLAGLGDRQQRRAQRRRQVQLVL